MKFRDLVRAIEDDGAVFVRHGGNHDWYRNVITGVREAIPRHAEVSEMLARKIIKRLATPKGGAS